MKNSPGQWAPWIWDPDLPQKPMTEAQMKRFVEGVGRLLEKAHKEDPQAGPGRSRTTPPRR